MTYFTKTVYTSVVVLSFLTFANEGRSDWKEERKACSQACPDPLCPLTCKDSHSTQTPDEVNEESDDEATDKNDNEVTDDESNDESYGAAVACKDCATYDSVYRCMLQCALKHPPPG